jgi:hypothetical protein
MTPHFEKQNRRKVRAILNLLTESTFFYRADEPELFDYLRRAQAEFQRFFEEMFGWTLYADRKQARLFKGDPHNAALPAAARDLFQLTRRDECLLFVLLLEFHEAELSRQNLHYERDEDVRFLLEDFVRFAIGRARELLGERAPPDARLFDSIASLFERLVRHRFVALVQREAAGQGETLPAGLTEHLLYQALPGLHCYDPSALNRSVFEAAYGIEQPAAESGEPAQEGMPS